MTAEKKIRDCLLNFLYPQVCPFCGEISPEGVCKKCRKKIMYIREPRCMHCGKPLKRDAAEYCPDCMSNASYLEQGRNLWIHREPAAGALYRLKYHNKRDYGKIFAREMAQQYTREIERWKIDEIMPIPLHPSRRRKRGFNQAEIMAGELASLTGIPLRTDVLFRIKKTSPQKSLGRNERQANLKGAFAVSGTWKACKNVLLIDDIYTTGATLERAAKMLRIAGAQNVYFLTVSIGQGI